MKKMIMMAAIAFLVAVGAGTGLRMGMGSPPAAEGETNGETEPGAVHGEPDHATVDRSHGREAASAELAGGHATTHGQPRSGETHTGTATGVKVQAHDEQPHILPPGAGTAAREAASHPDREHALGETGADEPGMPFPEMARLVLGMKPADAGRLLSHLSDEQVLAILRSMTVRDAWIVMRTLPAERRDALVAQVFDMEW
jgi:hypothetical protein